VDTITAVTDGLTSITPQRIVVFLPNWVGDAVMATPALRGLRNRFPQARITFFGKAASLAVLDGSGLCDETAADRVEGASQRQGALATGRRLRRGKYDLAVLLPNSFRSALIARWARVSRRLGYKRDGRGWLLTDHRLPPGSGDGLAVYPAVDYYLDLVAELGATPDSHELKLGVSDSGEERAEQLLSDADFDSARPLVLLNPGSSFGPSKLWPADRYAAAADALTDQCNAQIIINAAPGEEAIAAAVAVAMEHPPLVNLADDANSLALLKSLLKRADVLITNDTGARHIGAAMQTGLVTIFGSTDPEWTIIDWPRERIIRANVECSPCQKKRCPNPQGATFHQCMTAIEPQEVIDAAKELLAESLASKEAGHA
jgi:heptosyltransferase II